jgi:hypothetical protein
MVSASESSRLIDQAQDILELDVLITSSDEVMSPPKAPLVGSSRHCTLVGLTSSSTNPDITKDPLE